MLSKSSEYAIKALTYIQIINWQNRRPGVVEIAREIEAPEAFTAKILHTFTKHGLLDSIKGRGGGFFFNKNQSDLTLYDVIKLMEGDSLFRKCILGLKECEEGRPCPLHEQYSVLRDGLYEMVRSETIHSLSQKIKDGNAFLTHTTKR